jgi:hypothetical protein
MTYRRRSRIFPLGRETYCKNNTYIYVFNTGSSARNNSPRYRQYIKHSFVNFSPKLFTLLGFQAICFRIHMKRDYITRALVCLEIEDNTTSS